MARHFYQFKKKKLKFDSLCPSCWQQQTWRRGVLFKYEQDKWDTTKHQLSSSVSRPRKLVFHQSTNPHQHTHTHTNPRTHAHNTCFVLIAASIYCRPLNRQPLLWLSGRVIKIMRLNASHRQLSPFPPSVMALEDSLGYVSTPVSCFVDVAKLLRLQV
jgi:hypothetical protein